MVLQLSDEQLQKVCELRNKREEISLLQKDVDVLRAELLDMLEDASTDSALTASGAAAMHVTAQIRRGVNSSKLEAMYPDVYEEVMEEKTSMVLKVDYDDEL